MNGYTTLKIVHFVEPVSDLIVATVEIHGMYNDANTIYVNPDSLVKASPTPATLP